MNEKILYTAGHMWVLPNDDGTYSAGITDYAQDLLGDIVFVDAPKTGSLLNSGSPCGTIESVKTGSDLIAPLTGVVEETNQILESTPERINESPLATWIFKFRPTKGEDNNLMTYKEYQELISS